MTHIIRAIEDGVEFFTVEATGESGMSYSGLANLSGVNQSSISRLISDLMHKKAPKRLQAWIGKEIYLSLTTVKRGGKIKIVQMDLALDIVRHFYSEGKCTPPGCKLISMPLLSGSLPELQSKNQKRKKSIKGLERKCQEKLATELTGETEVPTPAGNIDVLTPTEVIEIKHILGWKQAIGQILVYGKYYPSHKKRIHLFGETKEAYLRLIQSHTDDLEIMVTWEP
ncbi:MULTISPECIES: hypothetical protein [unclassified Microcoleus]|uniref:hypothetical protein n=1 Tax=unclassified Microcoleus TaxID=2642155 RepID=UPI002FCF1AD0